MQRKVISPESLGFALREERKKKGLNQTDLGAPVGVDQTTVSNVEQGNPGTRLDTLFRLLSVLDLELVLQPKDVASGKINKEDW
ncbi:MAG: helix-turn-helix transcriptional regulator [Desulfuromusa sp.]|nr:helix-turn-helix transcriptional regulator [Desulfuromusa sp.]